MNKGNLAIVLHAHLPYVFHPSSEHRLEERWLNEAITETYIPLLLMMNRLRRAGVHFRLTISMTPTLLTMLADAELQARYLEHIDSLIELAEKEIRRTAEDPQVNNLADTYLSRFKEIKAYFISLNGDLISSFRSLEQDGLIELIGSAATHAFLPLVQTKEAVKAQLITGMEEFKRHFGHLPHGIWLPECGYAPEWDEVLKECGVGYFFVDAHGLTTGNPKPPMGTLAPVHTPNGITAFARDPSSSQQVWSSKEGYPGDYDYREYYRDIGFDLDLEYISPYIHPTGIRVNTGLKYYRITGQGDQKAWYDFDRAKDKTARHAEHFIQEKWAQLSHAAESMTTSPLMIAPFDAELFGHWWYEGPQFLEMLFQKLHYDQHDIVLVTPTEYLAEQNNIAVSSLSFSSWGRQGYADVWLRDENDWIYPALHLAEQRMITLATSFTDPTPLERRTLNQAARELMLAQSSDWAFIMDNKTMVDYAVERTKTHINRFTALFDMLTSHVIDEHTLTAIEYYDHPFPQIRFETYRNNTLAVVPTQSPKKRVVFLSWEFPPMTVGGLSRHAYDLSRHLVMENWEVHVVTTAVEGSPAEEVMDGVYVHRIATHKPDGGEFVHWVFALNLAMIEYCTQQLFKSTTFDVVHAHDWLVYYAAKALKEQSGLPLIATIHATEHGRNGGIFTDLQRYIHGIEWKLTFEAWRVVVCSTYMVREVEQIFHLPNNKIDMIPNGVDPKQLEFQQLTTNATKYALPHEKIVLFLGRLVREKGAQVLLEAIPEILSLSPDAKFVFTGEGPMRAELVARTRQLGIAHKVLFTGFVSDIDRNLLLGNAAVAVFPSLYEPFGIVALEAMAAGAPVVVSDVGGLADIIHHEQDGLTAINGDAHSFAIQVSRILTDIALAKRLAEAAKAEVLRYDWRLLAVATIDVYETVLKAKESEHAK